MSGPPVKQFGDDGGRREDANDAERTFQYYTPAKRRATLYEDVTVDTQPSTHRHILRGWPVTFDGVHGVWSDDSTAIRSSDWYAFRDPAGWWERVFYQVGTDHERQIEGTVRGAQADGLFDDLSPEWVEFLRTNLQVPSFVEHGLWLATASAARDCLSDTIAHCVVLEASLKQRMAQSIVLYAMDLEAHFGEMPIEPAKQRWLEHPAWQPARRYLERLRTSTDWMEVLVAANLCFEPLVGVLIRRELGIRAATANGDSITPVVASVGQAEWRWVSEWSSALMRFVREDEAHGEHNRGCVEGWVADWLPQAREAAIALGGLVEEMPVGIPFEPAWQRVESDALAYLESAGVGGAATVAT